MQHDKDYNCSLITQCELELSKQKQKQSQVKIKASLYSIIRATHLNAGLDGPTPVTAQSVILMTLRLSDQAAVNQLTETEQTPGRDGREGTWV